jgi:hypothetical protein
VDCPEPCRWPSITCTGWEVEERPFPQPARIEAFAEASPEGLECSWLAYGPASPHPTEYSITDGCNSGEGAPPNGGYLEVIAWDDLGKAATCTQDGPFD